MIGSLRGRLLDRDGEEALVEVCGVGYRVVLAPSTAAALGAVGDEVFLWVHHHVREDAQTLYGFLERGERVTFAALIGAHGVGPSLALAILSVHGPAELTRILADDDVAALCLVPGVGKKTAARLLVELKARLQIPELSTATAVGGNGVRAALGGAPTAQADVREALAGLGYSAEEIRHATAELPAEDDASALLREALQRLGRRHGA